MTRRARALPTANSYHDACISLRCCSGSPASSRVNNAAVARAASTSSARSLRRASRSERPQNRKRNHPRPPLLETTRVDGVVAAGARCDGVWVSSAAAARRGTTREASGSPRRRPGGAGSATVPSNRPRPRSAAVARNSPDGRETGPDAVRMHSKSHKKPPTSIIPGDDSYQGSEGASARRDAEILHVLRTFVIDIPIRQI